VFSIVLFFVFGEVLSRIFIGDILIKQFEDNGFYYYKPNQEGWYSAQYGTKMEAKINNIGARGDSVNIDFIKKNNKYVFLGDSFTFGWGLKDNETISYYFKEFMDLDNSQVLNYAEDGYGVKHMVESYKYYSEFFNKENVIIMVIMEHDFNRTIGLSNEISRDFLGGVKRHSSFINYLYEKIYFFLLKIEEQDFFLLQKLGGPYFNEEGEKELLEFRSILKENNQKFVIVFYEEEKYAKFSDDYPKRAGIFCEKNNIYCVTNISSIIKNIDGNIGKYAVDGKHSSAYSNHKVAEEIAKFIIKNNISLS
tara:strand:- start:494 stop:1417 length:924 start_codon:yes stop_codon:yes gene_type:complete